MILYCYDKNKVFFGSISARIDPLETKSAGHPVYLHPADTTDTEPPQEDHFAPVWNPATATWSLVEDHRGETIYSNDCPAGMVCTAVGSLPDGWSLTPPAAATLDELKKTAITTLWNNYKRFQQKYVDAEDLTLAVVCAANGSAKGTAVQRWVMQLWAHYYQVRDAVSAAATPDALADVGLTPDAIGEPPYTIRELNEEATASLNTQEV